MKKVIIQKAGNTLFKKLRIWLDVNLTGKKIFD